MTSAPFRHAAALALPALLLAAAPASAQRTVTLPAADRPLAGSPAPVFTAGGTAGPGALASASGAAFDARDNLYVLDSRTKRVVVFSPTGAVLRRIGGPDAGAGALQVPLLMTVMSDGQVAVADLGRQAMVFFAPDGTFRRAVPLEQLGGLPSSRGIRGHPGGGLLTALRGEGGATSLAWYATSGGRHSLVYQGRPPAQVRADSRGQTGGVRLGGALPVTFAPVIQWSVLPGGEVAVSEGTRYRVELRSVAGAPVRTLVRGIAPRPVTRADEERARRERMALAGGGAVQVVGVGGDGSPSPSAGLEGLLTQMTFADTMPVVQGLTADPAGVLWIGRAGRVYGGDAPADLVTPAGRYLGTVTGPFPAAISPGGLAAYVQRDGASTRVAVRRLPAAWRRP